MSTRRTKVDPSPHLFERSAPQLAKLVGLGELGTAPIRALPDARPAPVKPADVLLRPGAVDASALRRAGVAELGRTRSRVFEEFRIVQDQVLRLLATDSEPRNHRSAAHMLMVTSAAPGEGKSFVSANLAASLARCSERDVLLVDTDPKPSSLSHAFGLAAVPGLLDIAPTVGGDMPVTVYGACLERLLVLPIGGGTDRSLLSATNRLPDILRRLGRIFPSHVIVLDAPPCLASSDASMLAGVVDQVIMVTEAGRTQQSDVEAALDLVQSCGNIALLLNKVRSDNGSGFGSYGDYA